MMAWLLGPNGHIKRGLDLAGAGLVLLAGWPLFLLCALAVLLDDGWPVLYVHERVGRGGKAFPFFKFRTMVRNAHTLGAGYEVDAGDRRITRTGHFLRRWSLDELPQIFNILRGEMSLIGPRPTLQYQVETYTEFQRRRLLVRPGVTGLAQVSGRNTLTWPERILLDVHYVEHYSLRLDLDILMQTFGTWRRPDGIYGEGWAKKKGDPGHPGSA